MTFYLLACLVPFAKTSTNRKVTGRWRQVDDWIFAALSFLAFSSGDVQSPHNLMQVVAGS